MNSPRFFCGEALQVGQRLALPEQAAHHAVRVLRLGDGAQVVLFDGRGGEYVARLVRVGTRVWADILRHDPREAELGGRVTLVQGLAAGEKMDWIVEKAVEVGVAAVQPVAAQRSVLRLAGARGDRRLQHWQRIVRAASEQCGRNRLMAVAPVRTLAQALAQTLAQARARPLLLCGDPDASAGLGEVLGDVLNDAVNEQSEGTAQAASPHIVVLVGPEGGWSAQERHEAQACGAKRVRFGPRVLRTETAGIALVSAMAALLGW